jgi:hypothetical protein
MNTLRTFTAAAALMVAVGGVAQAQTPGLGAAPWRQDGAAQQAEYFRQVNAGGPYNPTQGRCLQLNKPGIPMMPADFTRYVQRVMAQCAERGRQADEREAAIAEAQRQEQAHRATAAAENERRQAARAEQERQEAVAIQEHDAAMRAETEKRQLIARQEAAAQQAVRDAAEKARHEKIAAAEADQAKRGYQAMSFEDFVLDGRKLAAKDAKVAVAGVYKKFGQMTALFPDTMTILQQRWDARLPIWITDDANRKVRQFLLTQCDNDPIGRGCQITLQGRATICTVTNLSGTHEEACIKVEDGWNY